MSKDEEKIVFQMRDESIYKIIVIGDPSVGKTSLLTKFATNQFKEQYLPTVGVNIVKEQVEIKDGEKEVLINLLLWDVAGQPQFYMLHRPYFNGADGVMLIFDITRSSTFSNINNWWSTCVKFGLSSTSRLLIGNKADLKDERKIIKPMADHLAEKVNAAYYETSAKEGENVKKIFHKMAELVYHSKMKK